jgi:hypothetical protein
MKPGSLYPLSGKAEALLSVEREIPPQPELVRRRAQLRARTALWQERSLLREAGGMPLLWRRLGLVAAAALFATSAVAAWLTVDPAGEEEGATVSAPVSIPGPTKAPVSKPQAAASPDDQTSTAGQDQEDSAAASKLAAEGGLPKRVVSTSRPSVRKERSSAPQELALLDQARRAVVGGKYRAALGLLDRHARSFPRSELREEREALRVRALKGAGHSKQAGQAASEFESRYPNSVLAPQMNESGRTSP